MDQFDRANMIEAMRLANTPAGQELIRQLQRSGGEDMQQAMSQAANGNFDSAKKLLSQMLSNPEVKKLMEQLRR